MAKLLEQLMVMRKWERDMQMVNLGPHISWPPEEQTVMTVITEVTVVAVVAVMTVVTEGIVGTVGTCRWSTWGPTSHDPLKSRQ